MVGWHIENVWLALGSAAVIGLFSGYASGFLFRAVGADRLRNQLHATNAELAQKTYALAHLKELYTEARRDLTLAREALANTKAELRQAKLEGRTEAPYGWSEAET